jgi:large subunit ribosomal protein L24
MRGDRKGLEGKVARVDRKNYRINVEGITREKVDGTAIQIPIHPSKVMITNLNLDDKWRRESLKISAAPTEEVKEAKKPEEKKPRRRKKAAEPEEVKEPEKEEKKRRPRRRTSKKTEEKPEEKKTEESESG